jgi:hypothetical protein
LTFEPFASSLQSAIYAIGRLGSTVELDSGDLFDENDGVDPLMTVTHPRRNREATREDRNHHRLP